MVLSFNTLSKSKRISILFVPITLRVSIIRISYSLISLIKLLLKVSFKLFFSFWYIYRFFYKSYPIVFLISPLKIIIIIGSEITLNGLKFQFTSRIKPIGKKQKEMRSVGFDLKDIDVDSLYSTKSGNKIDRSQTRLSFTLTLFLILYVICISSSFSNILSIILIQTYK